MILGLAAVAIVLAIVAILLTLWVKGYDLHGKWDKKAIPHECHVPNLWPNCEMPNGSVWRCRRCKKGWVVNGYNWTPLKESLERELNM